MKLLVQEGTLLINHYKPCLHMTASRLYIKYQKETTICHHSALPRTLLRVLVGVRVLSLVVDAVD